ncbi:MAG: helix-turn-helix domain-containing protein [Humibacillus sp.]|nr:helix-turn-helix domain-containing protein [Humibacillus sp.]MDN5778897.1 helix-turn-helix domain-containing protein [Humibacillus sp.]
METLETFLSSNLDRGRTARALQVHPNTVNNRLKRIADLVGLDPGTTSGAAELSAALIARRL